MATRFDNIFRPLATRLIDDTFGTPAVLISVSESYDVSTGKNSRSEVEHDVKISPPRPRGRSFSATGGNARDEGLVETGDYFCFVSAETLTFAPALEDILVWQDSRWQIVRTRPLVSGDQVAAYELTLRN